MPFSECEYIVKFKQNYNETLKWKMKNWNQHANVLYKSAKVMPNSALKRGKLLKFTKLFFGSAYKCTSLLYMYYLKNNYKHCV